MPDNHSGAGVRVGDGGIWFCKMQISGKECDVFLSDDPDGTAVAGDAGTELYYARPDGSVGDGWCADLAGNIRSARDIHHLTEFPGSVRWCK